MRYDSGLALEPMDLTTDIAADEQGFLDLEYSASEPYTSFAFSSAEQSRSVRAYLFARNLCEFSAPYGRLLRDSGRTLGMLAVLSGTELTKCRMRAALALAKSGLLREDAGLAHRVQLAGQTLLKLQPDDFYLSRIAVSAAARGRGIGTHLIQQTEREARERGCPRIALEVSPNSAAAVRLYLREGFQQIDARRVDDPLTSRCLEYLHLVKVLR